MKAFLKEGHVKAYKMVEVTWQRGHDPELELYECSGSPPSQLAKSVEPDLRIALSPFETKDLHVLLQCHGLEAFEHAVEITKELCDQMTRKSSWSWMWLASLGLLIPVLALCWRCRHTGPKEKLDEDEIDAL